MQLSAALHEKEVYQPRKAGRILSAVDLGEIKGKRTQNFKNYSMIHASDVIIDGEEHQGIDVTLIPDDPENSCSDYLGFTWELTSFNRDELVL